MCVGFAVADFERTRARVALRAWRTRSGPRTSLRECHLLLTTSLPCMCVCAHRSLAHLFSPPLQEKHEKKSKKDKKRKHEEEEVEVAETPVVEETPKEKKKKEKKAKKAKKEESDGEEETQGNSTSNALSSLADELLTTPKAEEEDEAVDLIALKKNKKMSVHSDRANGGAEKSGAFQPDENAVVIAEPVRIFLGNLPFQITDELIHECFDEFGAISGVHWVTDKATGKFYGTAFVDFEEASSAKAALVRNGVEILGRAIKVNVATGANVAGKNRFNTKEKNGGHLAKLPVSAKPDDCNTVFLGNLSFNIDDPTIREVFAHCGEISDVRWVEKDGEFKGSERNKDTRAHVTTTTDDETLQCTIALPPPHSHSPLSPSLFFALVPLTSCGFVEFVESWSTDEAVKLNGSDVLGRPMRVDYSARSSR